jgi:CRP/FNR family transcriptional regulator, cyclic AMP receptor protein
METVRLLRGVAVFDGLDEGELEQMAEICRQATFRRGEALTTEGSDENQMFVVRDGMLEVTVGEQGHGGLPAHTVVNLGSGQVVGEMSLVDHGPRSATVRCVTDTCRVLVIERPAFESLCESNHHIGMVVYRNLAADMSFKLRHRHLARR